MTYPKFEDFHCSSFEIGRCEIWISFLYFQTNYLMKHNKMTFRWPWSC